MKQAGEVLKAERLRQGTTLKDISRATKISVLTLEILEGRHEGCSPPPTYARGFLRAYAEELGLDAEAIITLYDEELQELQSATPEKKAPADAARLPGYLVPVIIGAVLLLVLALYFGYRGSSSERPAPPARDAAPQEAAPAPKPAQPEEPATQTTTAPASSPAPEPAGQAAADAAPAEPAARQPFTVRFVAGERCWMRFEVDDRHVFDVLLKTGEDYSVNAVSSMKVRIGNPGGLQAFFNGAPVDVPGRRGVPVDMTFPVAPDAARSP